MDNIGAMICGYDGYADSIINLAQRIKSQGIYTVVGYDTQERLPDPAIARYSDFFFTGGGHKGKQNGELFSMKHGFKIIADHGCEYALKLTGGAIITAPQDIDLLIDKLGDDDIICSHWWNFCGTMIFFGKANILAEVFGKIQFGWPQIEKKFTKAIEEIGAKYTIYPCLEDDRGIWGEILGFGRGNGNYNPIGDPNG